MWGEADSPWCQQEREGESLAWSDKRCRGHLRMEGGRELPCGSCQSPPMPVSLLLGTSVTVWREAGKNSRATTWKNISLPPSPDYGVFVLSWAFLLPLDKMGTGQWQCLFLRVQVCKRKKQPRPFDCSSKPKCPRFYGTHLTAQAVPQEAPTRVRAKGFTSIWIFLCCWVGLSWRLGLLNPQEKNNLTSWLMSRSVGERSGPNSVEIAKGRRGRRSVHITMATAQITQRMVYRQKEMPAAPPPSTPMLSLS